MKIYIVHSITAVNRKSRYINKCKLRKSRYSTLIVLQPSSYPSNSFLSITFLLIWTLNTSFTISVTVFFFNITWLQTIEYRKDVARDRFRKSWNPHRTIWSALSWPYKININMCTVKHPCRYHGGGGRKEGVQMNDKLFPHSVVWSRRTVPDTRSARKCRVLTL